MTPITVVLPCACGRVPGGVAATRTVRRPTPLREWGGLDEDGGWATEAVEEAEGGVTEEEPGPVAVSCPRCVAAAGPTDWAERPGPAAEDRRGQAPFVACNECGAEHVVT